MALSNSNTQWTVSDSSDWMGTDVTYNTLDSSSASNINIKWNPPTASGGSCNESNIHDNDEKALFHGVKSAFRMSRQSDGSEYGSEHPQRATAARSGAFAAIAYLQATDTEYDREESFEYLANNVLSDPSLVERLLSFVRDDDLGMVTDVDLEAGIDRAWTQIDQKQHHTDGARTMVAIAEAYLGEPLWDDDTE